MKAIIVAAGRGQRLLPETAEKPKCLLECMAGRRVLDWTLSALNGAGICDIVLVSGFSSELIRRGFPALRYIHNPLWESTNILGSLMCAAHEMDGGVIVSYSDIIYETETVRALIETEADVALIVDYDWRKRYLGRTEHPESEAEKIITTEGQISQIGKHLHADDANGEFIGLAYFSSRAADMARQSYCDALRIGIDMPFYKAINLRMAYLTDMLTHLLISGLYVAPVPVRGYWAEIDTPQDLARVRQELNCREDARL